MIIKVLFLNLYWFVRPDINTGWPLFLREMTRAMPSSFHLNNGRARAYIGPYKPSRFKNNTFIIILKHFQK